MVTTFNKKDVVECCQHVLDWVSKGMIPKNEDGTYTASLADVDNWMVGKLSSYSICPKAISTAQMLTYRTMGVLIDPLSARISLVGDKGLIREANSEGVVVAYPLIDQNENLITDENGRPKVGVYPESIKKDILRFTSIREERADFPYAHVSVPFATFPIYRSNRVIGFGACFHVSDVKAEMPTPSKNRAVTYSAECG